MTLQVAKDSREATQGQVAAPRSLLEAEDIRRTFGETIAL